MIMALKCRYTYHIISCILYTVYTVRYIVIYSQHSVFQMAYKSLHMNVYYISSDFQDQILKFDGV